jgi:hypothetical protein
MIVAAAIKIDGRVYGLPAPARHHDIIHMLAERGFKTPIKGVQGFIDDDLGFMERVPARLRVIDEKQKIREPSLTRELFSENLW